MRAKAASFNPLGDYCLVVTESMDLFVICVERIVSGTEVMGKASSGLSWHKEVVSQVYRAAPSSDSGDGVTSVLGAPSCVLWWETSDFIQLGIVGTDTGNLVVINLVSGTMVSTNDNAHPITLVINNKSFQKGSRSLNIRNKLDFFSSVVSLPGEGLCVSAGDDAGLGPGLRQPPGDHREPAMAGAGGAAEHGLCVGLCGGSGHVSRAAQPPADTC